MPRCPNGQRRIEGKCVYPELVKDCRQVAREYNKNQKDIWKMSKKLIDESSLSVSEGRERYAHIKKYIKSGGKVHWDDVYYIVLGAGGEGW